MISIIHSSLIAASEPQKGSTSFPSYLFKVRWTVYCWPKDQTPNKSSMIYFHVGSHSRKSAFLLIVIEVGFFHLACFGLGWIPEMTATIAYFKYNWRYKVRLHGYTYFLLIFCSQSFQTCYAYSHTKKMGWFNYIPNQMLL